MQHQTFLLGPLLFSYFQTNTITCMAGCYKPIPHADSHSPHCNRVCTLLLPFHFFLWYTLAMRGDYNRFYYRVDNFNDMECLELPGTFFVYCLVDVKLAYEMQFQVFLKWHSICIP